MRFGVWGSGICGVFCAFCVFCCLRLRSAFGCAPALVWSRVHCLASRRLICAVACACAFLPFEGVTVARAFFVMLRRACERVRGLPALPPLAFTLFYYIMRGVLLAICKINKNIIKTLCNILKSFLRMMLDIINIMCYNKRVRQTRRQKQKNAEKAGGKRNGIHNHKKRKF